MPMRGFLSRHGHAMPMPISPFCIDGSRVSSPQMTWHASARNTLFRLIDGDRCRGSKTHFAAPRCQLHRRRQQTIHRLAFRCIMTPRATPRWHAVFTYDSAMMPHDFLFLESFTFAAGMPKAYLPKFHACLRRLAVIGQISRAKATPRQVITKRQHDFTWPSAPDIDDCLLN